MQPTSYNSGLLFTRAHKAVRTRIYMVLEQYELSPSDWSIIGLTLSAPDGIRLSAVAKQMDVKAPLVTMLANRLIAAGLLDRVAHHSDGRAKLLITTSKGKKLAAKIENELSDAIQQLMHGVNPQDAQAFQRTLETIIANTQA